jgi:hypothetical protein
MADAGALKVDAAGADGTKSCPSSSLHRIEVVDPAPGPENQALTLIALTTTAGIRR